MSGPTKAFVHLSTNATGSTRISVTADGGLTFTAQVDSMEITDVRTEREVTAQDALAAIRLRDLLQRAEERDPMSDDDKRTITHAINRLEAVTR